MKKLVSLLMAALSTLSLDISAKEQQADLMIRHVNIVDIAQERILSDKAVVIQGDSIIAVGDDSDIEKQWSAAQTILSQERFLIPGLWDMHVHFGGGPELIEENKALLPLYVAHGVTTIRDASGDLPNQVLQWRNEINEGTLFGPQLFTSGAKIEGVDPVWKGTIEVGSEDDVDAAIERLMDNKVDFVKITDSTLKPELFLYALKKLKSLGLPTSGHIPMELTVEQAIEAGISSIEHISYAYKAGVKDEAKIAADYAAGDITRAEAHERLKKGFDSKKAMAAYRHFAQEGVFVTPTLNGSRIISYLDKESHENDPYLAYIGPKLRETYNWRVERASKATPEQIEARHQRFEQRASILPMLQEAGVTIMAGTDAGFLNSYNYPGIGLHDELSLFVEKGLTPAQALAAATIAGPTWFGKDNRYGSIATGKAADLVLLKGNPLKSIEATRQIESVIMRGKLYNRRALDKMLEQAKEKVAAWDLEEKNEQ